MNRIALLLVGFIAWAAAALLPEIPRTPMVVKFSQHQFVKRGHAKVIAGGHGSRELLAGIVRRAARAIQAVADFPLRLAGWAGGDLVAGHATVPLLPAEMKTKFADYEKLAGEALALQEKYKGQPMPQNVGEEFQAKCQEAETLWGELEPHMKTAEERVDQERKNRERASQVSALREAGKQVVDPTMPGPDPEDRPKNAIAGYITLGQYVTSHPAYQKAAEGGFRHPVELAVINAGIARAGKLGIVGPQGEPLVALNAEERKQFEQAWEGKSLVSIGAGVIEPQRLSVEPKVTADDRLRLRDVIPVGQTGSASVSYIREDLFTRAAAETTPGVAKPEAGLSYTEQTATVRTIPTWVPVTTDQLADWPGLRSRIDNRLIYDIKKREEEEFIYGDGSAPNLQGILDISGTQSIEAHALYVAGNDLLEKVRLGITMVARAGYQANAMLIDPLDWFAMVVLKGSDKHYLGQVFMTADRVPRVWGIGVIETVAVEATAGVATEARNLIVADFIRGAEILDRMQVSVSVGLNNDDFTKNRRTILAEERLAFPIYAPAAFAYLETQASAT